MIDFENFEVGTFWFTASERNDWIEDPNEPFGGRPGEDYVELQVSWNDWPTVIGKYPRDVTLEHVKQEGAKWLIAKLDEWKAEAVKLLPNNFLRQSEGAAKTPLPNEPGWEPG